VIVDRREPLRTFRMIGSHLVQQARWVGDVRSGGHGPVRFVTIAHAARTIRGGMRHEFDVVCLGGGVAGEAIAVGLQRLSSPAALSRLAISSSICDVWPQVKQQGGADQREADTRRHEREQERPGGSNLLTDRR